MVWVVYFIGQLLHILRRANAVASSPVRNVRSTYEFMVDNIVNILIRLFLTTLVMSLWVNHPNVFSTITGGAFNLPLLVETAGFYGFFADSVLDWGMQKMPWFKDSDLLK